jgi:hypothetical protein
MVVEFPCADKIQEKTECFSPQMRREKQNLSPQRRKGRKGKQGLKSKLA